MGIGEPEFANSQVIWKNWLDKWFYWLLAAGILTNATGLFLPIMEPDGCLYAMISKTMVLSGDYIHLKVEGKDWLDKPHFPFWVVALFFKVFGIHGFIYKLPAFIFWLIGARYTFLFAKRLYNPDTAKIAVIIYLAAEHLVISNNDVRAEPYLTGLIVPSVYYYYRVYREGKWPFVLYGSLFLAAAIMTKGIFIAGLVASGFLTEWILKRKWDEFNNPRWWTAILLTFIFILPELYSLYVQFDLHPEKLVYGRTGVSGVRFFFWDSQFGRFFNNGPIRGEGNIFFYLHTILWAFLPWPAFALLALVSGFKNKSRRIHPETDFICPSVFIIGFLAFSFSKFQLPHYLNILYPFLSIMVARYLFTLHNGTQQKILLYAQQIIYILVFIFCIAICFVAGLEPAWIITAVIFILFFILYRVFPGSSLPSILGISFACAVIANIFLNIFFYPLLFKYQSGLVAAKFVEHENMPGKLYTLPEPIPEFAFEFYSASPVGLLEKENMDTLKEPVLVFAPKQAYDSLRSRGLIVVQKKSFPNFHISQVSGEFLNRSTRAGAIDSTVLATVSGTTGTSK